MKKAIISISVITITLISGESFGQVTQKQTVKKLNLSEMNDLQIEDFAKKSFEIMDKNKDGYISKAEAPVARVTTTKNDKVSDISINSSIWINRNDSDGNGLVDLKEFSADLKKIARKKQ